MAKVTIKCLMCFAKIEAEPGVESVCPKCGASFKLKADVTQKDFEKEEKTELDEFGDLVNVAYEQEDAGDFEGLAETAHKLIKIEDEVFEGWAFLAKAEAGKVLKLIAENKFNDSRKVAEVDDYFEKAYEVSLEDKEVEKLKPVNIDFLRKNMIHACNFRIESMRDSIKSFNGEGSNENFKNFPDEIKKEYTEKFLQSIKHEEESIKTIETLDDESLVVRAKLVMGKSPF